jgi:hypothetical protein
MIEQIGRQHLAGGIGDGELRFCCGANRLGRHAAGPKHRQLVVVDSTASPLSDSERREMPIAFGGPIWTGAPWTEGIAVICTARIESSGLSGHMDTTIVAVGDLHAAEGRGACSSKGSICPHGARADQDETGPKENPRFSKVDSPLASFHWRKK